ncbi:hypothetical protein K2173_006560 [Erythroxylum novogranatense]|uniref:FCP1 homology domain-containing protein n=1 Tax=Erythroxylum novogranatense TaxID=1862640 RepID=A0AAV8T6V4_9ROSI|nr:hypothetical protein K2173_006560 [Erythroxylum novogranatense]
MVCRSAKRTPTRCTKDRRGQQRRYRKKSPSKVSGASSAIISSINKTIISCKKRLARLFSKLARIGTPNSRYKGYEVLKKRTKLSSDPEETSLKEGFGRDDNVCRVLFFNEKLPPLISSNKRTVFLDLDETLVHSNADPPPQKFDFVVRPKIDGEFMNFYVLKRPGVDTFLEALAAKYEVVVFTAGLKEYASLVLDRLDLKGLISHRLYRDSCKVVGGRFVKDLSEMGRDLNKVVIVDDNPHCYLFQPENAIPVKPFIDDVEDRELWRLSKFFEACDGFEDMRNAVKQFH